MPRHLLILTLVPLVAGCGPRIDGELIAGRTVMITNREDAPLSVTRLVANNQGGRAECVDDAATVLAPGRSYSTTFFLCEEVREVEVETDQGRREINFD
jgi:hypothetical protein